MQPSNLVSDLRADLQAAASQCPRRLAKRPLPFIGAYCAVRLVYSTVSLQTLTMNEPLRSVQKHIKDEQAANYLWI